MATTREYTDYLNDQVDIAPADSQEELQAAELIESIFVQHGLETQVQEFDTPRLSGLSSRIYLIVLFLGIVLAGFWAPRCRTWAWALWWLRSSFSPWRVPARIYWLTLALVPAARTSLACIAQPVPTWSRAIVPSSSLRTTTPRARTSSTTTNLPSGSR